MQRDEEHNAWTLKVDDRGTGYSRIDTIGPEFVTSGEFRTLAAGYLEISHVLRSLRKGPIEVRITTNGKAPEESETPDEGLTAEEKEALEVIGVAPTTASRGRGGGCEGRAGVGGVRSTSSSITSSRSAARAWRSTATRASAK